MSKLLFSDKRKGTFDTMINLCSFFARAITEPLHAVIMPRRQRAEALSDDSVSEVCLSDVCLSRTSGLIENREA